MALIPGSTQEIIAENIRALVAQGVPEGQAVMQATAQAKSDGLGSMRDTLANEDPALGAEKLEAFPAPITRTNGIPVAMLDRFSGTFKQTTPRPNADRSTLPMKPAVPSPSLPTQAAPIAATKVGATPPGLSNAQLASANAEQAAYNAKNPVVDPMSNPSPTPGAERAGLSKTMDMRQSRQPRPMPSPDAQMMERDPNLRTNNRYEQ